MVMRPRGSQSGPSLEYLRPKHNLGRPQQIFVDIFPGCKTRHSKFLTVRSFFAHSSLNLDDAAADSLRAYWLRGCREC